MKEVSILIRYFGGWEKYDLNYIYKGGKNKDIIVSDEISYVQLMDKIRDITKLGLGGHDIQMKYLYNVHGPTELVEIEGDDDVRFFLRCNIDRSILATSLCISSQIREFNEHFGENLPYIPRGDHVLNSIEERDEFPTFGCSRNIERPVDIGAVELQQNDYYEPLREPLHDIFDDCFDGQTCDEDHQPINNPLPCPVDSPVNDSVHGNENDVHHEAVDASAHGASIPSVNYAGDSFSDEF